MDQHSFQLEVIDRLGRIEEKQDQTNGRVRELEKKTHSLELTRASNRGVNRLAFGTITAGAGVLGAGVIRFLDYIVRK